MAASTAAAPTQARAESRSPSQIAATSAATSASAASRIEARTGLSERCAMTCTENAIPDPTLRALAQNRTIVGDTAGSIGGISLDGAGNSSGGLSWTFLGRNALAEASRGADPGTEGGRADRHLVQRGRRTE